jgi:serine protease
MKNSVLVLAIISGLSMSVNASNKEQHQTLDVAVEMVQDVDAMPINKFKKIDEKNHLILVKFKDKKVRKSMIFVPEMKEKIKSLRTNKNSMKAQKLNVSIGDRGYAIEELSNVYMETNILLKHVRSNSLGYEQFHVTTNDIEGAIKKLMDTGRFDIVELDVKIESNKFDIKPIIDIKNSKSQSSNGDFEKTGYNSSDYGDEFAYLQEYLDDQEFGNMGSHGFLSGLEYVKNNNNLGRKVRIAVIDTGYMAHEDIDEIVEGADFVSGFGAYQDCLVYDDTYQGLDVICSPEDYKEKERDNDPTDKSWIFPSLDENGVPTGDGTIAVDGHGLAVSSTIAGRINDRGIIGALGSDNVDIVHIRGLGFTGGLASDIFDAITWASGGAVPGFENISEPVDIINLSLGSTASCTLGGFYSDVIQFALSQGVVVVSASGNNAEDAKNFAPANCEGVLAVAADNSYGDVASFSNYGDIVDISFRGEQILVASSSTRTYEDPDFANACDSVDGVSRISCYGYISGTSFSAPLASSAIGLLKMVKPELSQVELRSILIESSPQFNEDILGKETRRSNLHPQAGVGNIMNALTTNFDRLFIDNLRVVHAYSEYDTTYEEFYFSGLLQYANIDKICRSYNVNWKNFTDAIDGITYTLYGSTAAMDIALTESNSDVIQLGINKSQYSLSVQGYSRLGVQANNGDIFEFDFSNATLPTACL